LSSQVFQYDQPVEKLVSREAAATFAADARAAGRTVVFANGCFDIVHGGHVSYLDGARAEGDVLIVGVNSDASERRLKGEGRPIVTEAERAELLAGMESVDRVFVFEEDTAEASLEAVRPDVHAKGTDYTAETVPERNVAQRLGIRVAITGASKQNASKKIIHKIQQTSAAE
jgi:rfaE bifunctional protein nucleotidyltransferase chain/domain